MGSSTCRSSWAGNRRRDNSQNCITFVGYTLIWWLSSNLLSRDISEHTLSSASVATVNGTNVLVVTDFADM
jgi:hypothetical protein